MKICGESREDVRLKLDSTEVSASVDSQGVFRKDLESDSCLSAFLQESRQIPDSRVEDVDVIIGAECSENDECSRFDVVVDDIEPDLVSDFGYSTDHYAVIVVHLDLGSGLFPEFDEIHDMGLDCAVDDPGIA